jgi:diketogulonate reductase-like aldo/keto reductase
VERFTSGEASNWRDRGAAIQVLAPYHYLADLSKQSFAKREPAGIKAVTHVGGRLYFVPPAYSGIGAIYNMNTLGKIGAQPPTTWSQVLNLCDKAKAAGIADVQNRLDASTRDPVIGRCEASGIAYLGYSPFEGSPHAAKRNPRAAEIAAAHMASPHQVVIARHFLSSSAITVIVGARRPATIRDSAAAATLRLTPGEIALIEAAEPPAHSPHPAVSAV